MSGYFPTNFISERELGTFDTMGFLRRDEGAGTVELAVQGMHCEHCQMRVRKALEGVKGVKGAVVDLEGERATVTLGRDVPVDELVEAVRGAGYDAREAE